MIVWFHSPVWDHPSPFYNGIKMFIIRWLLNLFKKKDKRLVAIISGPFVYRLRYCSASKGTVSYYLYEYSHGKRTVLIVRTSDNEGTLEDDSSRRSKLYQLMESWEDGSFNSRVIPSYMMMDDLRQPVILDSMDDANLNKLF